MYIQKLLMIANYFSPYNVGRPAARFIKENNTLSIPFH